MTQRIPNTWLDARLEEIAEIHDHLREPVNSTERAGRQGPYPYYGAAGQVGWIDGFRQDGEYVLLGEDGAPFLDPTKPKAYMVSGKCWVNNHAHVLKGVDGICANKYLLHALNVVSYRGYANGTTRLKLTQEAMRRLPIRIAPPKEQHRIVEKIDELLSDLDAGVAALERARANLKRYRAAVLKAAVEGRLTEQWRKAHPDVEPASKLLERVLVERRRKWEEAQLAKLAAQGKQPPKGWKDKYPEPAKPNTTNLPELPEGWCWATVDQTSEVQGGIQKQPKRAPKNNAYPYLRVANVHRNRLDLTELEYFELFGNELERLRLQVGDLLVVEGNGSKTEIGRSAVWRGEVENCVHQNHIIRVRFAAGLPEYLNAYWNSPPGNARVMDRAASTSGLYTLSVQKVSRLPLPLPPPKEQEGIVEEVESRLSVIAHSESQVDNARTRGVAVRQAILKRAFEGKLVPQDPNDEPASMLLERIRAVRRSSGSGGETLRRNRRRESA